MKIIGIVSEYNPFHNGHAYQVQKSKQLIGADGIVAIMSGNFVQRGYPAFYDKWKRAEMAVEGGVNLVIELPTYYATSSAEGFSQGAIDLLEATGVITHLSFGSELDVLDALKKIAYALNHPTPEFNETLKESLSKGHSFPKAREMALHSIMENPMDLNQANLILAIEYLRALDKRTSPILPVLIKRRGKGYHDTSIDSPLASATAIRKGYFDAPDLFEMADFMPPASYHATQTALYPPLNISNFESMILYKIRQTTPEALSKIREVSEGLENKIYQAAIRATTYEELVHALKSKRYTLTRINRILINILLEIDKTPMDLSTHGYIRVLAMDAIGKKIIHRMKKNCTFPIITNVNKYLPQNPLLDLDIKASNIYQLGFTNPQFRRGGRDHLEKPHIKNGD